MQSKMQSSRHIGNIVRSHANAVENGKIAASASGSSSGRKRKTKSSGSSFLTVPKHRAFVPLVTIWGGVFMALIMAVMPEYAIARAAALSGFYLPIIAARVILAVGVGLAGALLGFIVASALANYIKKRDGDDGLVTRAIKSRDFEPINPVADLGSESLDAPLDQSKEHDKAAEDAPEQAALAAPADTQSEPTLGELSRRGFEIEEPSEFADNDASTGSGEWAFTRKHFKNALIESCEGESCEAAPAQEPPTQEPIPQEPPMQEPSAQDTVQQAPAAFAPLSAVEIRPLNEPAQEQARRPIGCQTTGTKPIGPQPIASKREALDLSGFSPLTDQAEAPTSALEVLRQKPASDLSLVEMVERFAAALHDHQEQERARFEHNQRQSQMGRDAALAEALKALTLFTERGFDQAVPEQVRAEPTQNGPTQNGASQIEQAEGELRGALDRLQGLRGAA